MKYVSILWRFFKGIRLDALLLQNATQNTGAAGQVHGRLGLEFLDLHPLQQPLAKNFGIVIPSESIVDFAKYIAVHLIAPFFSLL